MEQKQIVDLITREVLSRIQAGASAIDSPVCTGTSESCVFCNLCVTKNPEGVKNILRDGASRVTSTLGVINVPADVASYIDHTLLKPDAQRSQIEQLCDEAAKYGFCSVCVNTYWADFCARRLRGKGVKVCCVVGFPLGAMDSRTKGFEARNAVGNGASEIDMVINVGALKSGDIQAVEEDIRSVMRSCRATTVKKVIIETCLLSDDEKVIACELSKKAGADYVKTSTGFAKGGATAQDIALMRRVVGPDMGIKAAGGVRSFEDAKQMIESGATRIGASASVKIVSGEKSEGAY
jgi:deoxyribose-phosphate aldolase